MRSTIITTEGADEAMDRAVHGRRGREPFAKRQDGAERRRQRKAVRALKTGF